MSGLKIGKSGFRAILSATFVAGTLDIIAAIVIYSFILEKTSPSTILMSIASGVFGKAAYSGGVAMMLTGLLFHFLITFLFSLFYYFLYQIVDFLRQQMLFSGLLYGVFIWAVMNLIVLPTVFPGRPSPDAESALTGIVILMLAVGVPISYITATYNRS